MIPVSFDKLQESDLQDLITNQVREGKTIEYKSKLPGNSDSDKKEYLADVSSLANTAGGDLIFGVEETDGVPSSVTGLTLSDTDKELQRLDNMLQSGLEPRLPVVIIQPVQLASRNVVLVIRVARSWIAPHRVVFKGSGKFFARNSSGKYPLDVDELRIAFTLSSDIELRIRDFRSDRLARLIGEEMPALILDGPRLVLHLLPLAAFSGVSPPDIRPFFSREGNSLLPFKADRGGGLEYRMNLDGVVVCTGSRDLSLSYVQLFRTGSIESVCAFPPGPAGPRLPARDYERELTRMLPDYLSVLEQLDIIPPVYLFLSFLGMQGCILGLREEWMATEPPACDREHLLLPEVVIDRYDLEPASILRPTLDVVWNAFGLERSLNFDAAGNWIGQA